MDASDGNPCRTRGAKSKATDGDHGPYIETSGQVSVEILSWIQDIREGMFDWVNAVEVLIVLICSPLLQVSEDAVGVEC